jgi:hypothetical protein
MLLVDYQLSLQGVTGAAMHQATRARRDMHRHEHMKSSFAQES